MKAHPLINFNPCLPTFKLTMLNYQGSFMTINPFLSFHNYINTVIIFPMRSLLEHTFSEIKTKPFCLNFFHCTYFKGIGIHGLCIYNGTLKSLFFEISQTQSWELRSWFMYYKYFLGNYFKSFKKHLDTLQWMCFPTQ